MKQHFIVGITILVMATFANAAKASEWAYILQAGKTDSNYGQIKGYVYLGPNSTFTNYGQILGDIVCDHCTFLDYGQTSGKVINK
jgi:hypothetical protein